MKKIPKIINLIMIAALLGFVYSFLLHNQLIYKLTMGLKSIKWYFYFLIIILNFFLVILIHELGHLFSFIFNKIKIKALLVLPFVFVKKDRWRFMIKFKNLKLVGGLVVPELPNIQTEEEFKEVKQKFSKAIIAGPITSLIYFVIILVLFLIFWIFTYNFVLIGLFLLTLIVTSILTILIQLSSKINTNNIYGDYVAYEKFKDDKFSLLQIVQYSSFGKEDEKTNKFLYEKIKKYYQNNKPTYNLFDIMLVSYLLNFFISQETESDDIINNVINFYNINSLLRKEEALELVFLISSYYYKINNVAKSYDIYFKAINTNIKNTNKQKLIFLQYEHFLNLKDNNTEILNSKDEVIKELDILEPIYDVDSYLESMTNKLDFKEYKTDYITFL